MTWVTIAECPTQMNEEDFWLVMKKWTLNPEYSHTQTTQGFAFRHLIDRTVLTNDGEPTILTNHFRYNGADVSIEEKVELNLAENSVTFRPEVSSYTELPSNYIPLEEFKISFSSFSLTAGEAELSLAFAGRFYPATPNSTKKEIKRRVTDLGSTLNVIYHRIAQSRLSTLVNSEAFNSTFSRLLSSFVLNLVVTLKGSQNPLTLRSAIEKDIAIASLLITLWEKERDVKKMERKQTFLDLGCGLGVVTYILTQEGYEGKGVDVRRHPSWEQFPSQVNLQVEEITIDNARDCAFLPNHDQKQGESGRRDSYDWIVGNRSDELTPWIIYATSFSPTTNYFLLPCCFWDFGRRFESSSSSGSYRNYLDRLKQISLSLGIETEEGIIEKISSEKNRYLIGRKRIFRDEEESIKMAVREKQEEYFQQGRATEKINQLQYHDE